MKVLCIHGVGHESLAPDSLAPWENAISHGLKTAGYTDEVHFAHPLLYHDLFDSDPTSLPEYGAALGQLLTAWLKQSITTALFPGTRGFLGGIPDTIHWHAGIVAQWVIHAELRATLRDRFFDVIDAEQPDLICAHSHGSLISYDLLVNDPRGPGAIKDRTYLTFGSQIGHPGVVGRMWNGRIKPLPTARAWHHLWNPLDPIFTQAIRLPGTQNFSQATTLFGSPFVDPSAHSPVTDSGHPGYLDHPVTAAVVWPAIAGGSTARLLTRTLTTVARAMPRPRRRALLVGINAYPDAASRLEGCVNDAFLMSSLLQERGFAPEDIRVLTDERATASAIRERLEWLLEGAEDGMERVFTYSGHGAQLPGYSAAEKIDHVDECLVPYDFDWTLPHAITDDDFVSLYSNLPLKARFVTIIDACHAGGMHRDGGPRARGLNPPDDVRHRLIEWNEAEQMWTRRALPAINPDFGGNASERADYMGAHSDTFRLFRGMTSRTEPSSTYHDLPADERGPYLPVIIEACQENSLSYEYRSGTISYGAFTYSLVKNLRAEPTSTYVQLVDRSAETLTNLGYRQVPRILGPKAIVNERVPGIPASATKTLR